MDWLTGWCFTDLTLVTLTAVNAKQLASPIYVPGKVSCFRHFSTPLK